MIHQRTLNSLEFRKVVEQFAGLCESPSGRERALALCPLPGGTEVVQAFKLYEEFLICFFPAGTNAGFQLPSFPDISALIEHTSDARTSRHPLDMESFWAIRETLALAQNVHKIITVPENSGVWPHLFALASSEPLPMQFITALLRCISDDALIRDAASPELYRIRSELRRIHQTCSGKIKEFARQYNIAHYLQDEFITLSSDRYVLPLKSNFKGKLQGIIHDWSQTGETCYFEPMFLLELNNRLQNLRHEERAEEQRILKYLQEIMFSEIDGVRAALELLTALDVLQAKRRLADLFDGHCLTITSPAEGINLLEARHPLLALDNAKGRPFRQSNTGKESNYNVRPLQIQLRPGEQALIITGGNAGGKTVCLKTLGLVAVMAYSGLPVSVAKGSSIPWFDRIDAFIGDEQSLENSVSTFTAQMQHIAKALKYLDNNGLVLLDEFGSGTDPAEGAALALAVCDELLEQGAYILAATHFPALKSYALTHERIRAASMLFDPETRKPLFRIAYDQVGASQALHVARECGLTQTIVDRAERYLLHYGQETNDILDRLNALAARRDKELGEFASERQKANDLLRQTKERLEKERYRLYDEIRIKVRDVMQAWKAGRLGHKQALKEMTQLRAPLAHPSEPDGEVTMPVENLQLGQRVIHRSLKRYGTVTELDVRHGRLRLNMDGVTVWARSTDIAASHAAALPNGQRHSLRSTAKDVEGSLLRVDLRGMSADEAVSAADRFVDQAVLAGCAEIEIVHGKGTGALRREIHNFLRTVPSVAHFAAAPEGRGGDGMTVVNLR